MSPEKISSSNNQSCLTFENGRSALNAAIGITVLVLGILCLKGLGNSDPSILKNISISVLAMSGFSLLLNTIGNDKLSWKWTAFSLVALLAIYLPGIFGCYSATTLGWLMIGPAVAATGIAAIAVTVGVIATLKAQQQEEPA